MSESVIGQSVLILRVVGQDIFLGWGASAPLADIPVQRRRGYTERVMELFRRPIISWKVACWIAIALLFLPLVLPPYTLPFGFNVFFAWTALCIAAVLGKRMALWAALCISPLATLSIDWLRGFGFHEDEFGFFPWGNIALFCGVAIVTAATGILSILRTSFEQQEGGC